MTTLLDCRGNKLSLGELVSMTGREDYAVITVLGSMSCSLLITTGPYKGSLILNVNPGLVMKHDLFTTHDLGETFVKLE